MSIHDVSSGIIDQSGFVDTEQTLTPSDPIDVFGNIDFQTQAGLHGWTGNGSESNPYTIENQEISSQDEEIAISIEQVDFHVIIQNNLITGGNDTSIYLRDVANMTIRSNSIDRIAGDNPLDCGITGYGIDIDGSYGILVEENTIKNSCEGVVVNWRNSFFLSVQGSHVIRSNLIEDNRLGVVVNDYLDFYSTPIEPNQILDNTILDASTGIYESGYMDLVANNYISSDTIAPQGIFLGIANGNSTKVINNTLDNLDTGITINQMNANQILFNTFKSTSIGIKMFTTKVTNPPELNTIMWNQFLLTEFMEFDITNALLPNNTIKLNYFDSLPVTDADTDGIIDNSTLPDDFVDRYPLASTFETGDSLPGGPLFNLTVTETDGNVEVTWTDPPADLNRLQSNITLELSYSIESGDWTVLNLTNTNFTYTLGVDDLPQTNLTTQIEFRIEAMFLDYTIFSTIQYEYPPQIEPTTSTPEPTSTESSDPSPLNYEFNLVYLLTIPMIYGIYRKKQLIK